MPDDEALQRDKVAEEASHQRHVLDAEAERQRAEVRAVARDAAKEVVNEAVLTAVALDETQASLTQTITDLIKKVGVRKRHAVILYVLVAGSFFIGALLWWNIDRVSGFRCEARNDANAGQIKLWEATILDAPPPETPEAQRRLVNFTALLHETFPQEDCG